MYAVRLEELGPGPLKELLQEFGGWPVVEGDKWNDTNFVYWYETIYKLIRVGYPVNFLSYFVITTDMKNSTSRLVEVIFFSEYSLSLF